MKIESVDFYYLAMPEIYDIGDGSQDALLVRISAGGYEGWGECEASPLVSIAGFVCPMSHSACKPVSASVLGRKLDSPGDIRRINELVRENSFDMLQADHTLSGIDIALWDLLGRKFGEPVYKLLGCKKAYPKISYASQLFGDNPGETFKKAENAVKAGFRAAKFGWGPFGKKTLKEDKEQVEAARAGLGRHIKLMVDAGTVWKEDVEKAAERLGVLEKCGVVWLEEPFASGAIGAYNALAGKCGKMKLAGGEGSHNPYMAKNLIDYGKVGYIQIDAGRIGGITSAAEVAGYAALKKIHYVNHTFTTHLALSASFQPYAGSVEDVFCEYPLEPSVLARELTCEKILPDKNGEIRIPEKPGLGINVNMKTLKKYIMDVEIKIGGRIIYKQS